MKKAIISVFLSSMFILIVIISSGCGKQQAKPSQQKPIRIGYMICNSLPETKARFEPLTNYLSEKLGRPVEAVYLDTVDVEDWVRRKEVDFTHTNSILYVIFKERYGARLLASEVRGRYGFKDAGTIIARKGSGIETIQDLKGKSMVFGPALAPMGYLSQYDLMLKNNINPEEDLGYYNIPWGSFKHEKAVYGVLHGAYQVGAAPRLDLDQMSAEAKINLDDLVIIAENEPIPYCTVAAMADVEPELAQKVKTLLCGLTKEETVLVDGEVLKILKSAWIDGFMDAPDTEYDSIRKMLKRCNMAPYEEY